MHPFSYNSHFRKLFSCKILIRKRALIETVNDELKNIAQIERKLPILGYPLLDGRQSAPV